ncbi:MAG: VOC family protein [Janthinobacterium lividum]
MTAVPDIPQVSEAPGGREGRILCLMRNVRQLERSTAFYETRLGFVRCGPPQRLDAALAGLWSPTHRPLDRQRLRLGASELDLVGVGAAGAAPYPDDSRADDLWFQHFAIRCPDIEQAFLRLYRPEPAVPVPRALSGSSSCGGDGAPGPVVLPARSGGVTAFKFRDPDGHPVELLGFPARSGVAPDASPPGIDHSAISVSNVANSIAFYRRWLGFTVDARQWNVGVEQDRLDGLQGVRVDVVALRSPSGCAPHLELLGYDRAPGSGPPRVPAASSPCDVVSDRLVVRVADLDALRHAWLAAALPVEASTPDALLVRDPDRHLLMLTR